jgi:NADH-quinone oxidoreductase subunit C
MNIETYNKELHERFPDIIRFEVINIKRLMVHIPSEILLKITEFLFRDLGYRYIIVTGMDSKDGYEIIYHYSDDKSGWVVNLNVLLPHNKPEIESITPVVYGAEWIERELMDILGIKFHNHPKPERFLFSEDWPEGKYPYRREIRQEKR